MKTIVYFGIVGSIQNLTDANFEEKLKVIKNDFLKDTDRDICCLIHGFMPIKELEAKGIDTTKREILDREFPYQFPFYVNGAPDREYLQAICKTIQPDFVAVLTNPNDNVLKEIEYFDCASLFI